MKEQQNRAGARLPYNRPEVRRVELAVEETLTAGCKLDGSECTAPPIGPLLEAGS